MPLHGTPSNNTQAAWPRRQNYSSVPRGVEDGHQATLELIKTRMNLFQLSLEPKTRIEVSFRFGLLRLFVKGPRQVSLLAQGPWFVSPQTLSAPDDHALSRVWTLNPLPALHSHFMREYASVHVQV